MASKRPAPCRLFCILARAAPAGVLFRRGPSNWVQLIKWNTKTDAFEHGQWFKGRIYERRCDLSPDGSLLIYFAQKLNQRTLSDPEYTFAWTAISKPPFLTALALWPKGDCWDGGGLFKDSKTVLLNHKPDAKPHPKHQPKGLKIILNAKAAGEDERLWRDDWRTEQAGIWMKPNATGKFILTMKLDAIDMTAFGGPFLLNFGLTRMGDGKRSDLGRATWADWDHRGRLVLTKQGKLFAGKVNDDLEVSFAELADFNSAKPVELESPA